MKILCLVGGIAKESLNKKVFNAMAKLAPDGVVFTTFEIERLPFFSQDLEQDLPEVVRSLKYAIEESDGIMVITPEYNRSIPGVLKNALDWGSRPYGKNSFKGKPAGVLGASVGNIGTFGAQNHLRAVLMYLDTFIMPQPETYLNASKAFNDQGELSDPKMREILQKYWGSFTAWVNRQTKQLA